MITRNQLKEDYGGTQTGIALANRVMKLDGNRKLFLVDDEWISEPKGRVKDLAFCLSEDDIRALECARKIWNKLEARKLYRPAKGRDTLFKIWRCARNNEELILFTPWGPRYGFRSRGAVIRDKDKEIATLEELAEVADLIREEGINVRNLLMYADLYGSEVNSLPDDVVEEYGRSLGARAEEILDTPLVVPWSEIKKKNQEKYDVLCEELERDFDTYVSRRLLEQMIEVGKRFNPGSGEEASRKYGVERLVEGRIIDEVYDPIKVSLVPKYKDVLDGPLRRIYVIANTSPWLGGM